MFQQHLDRVIQWSTGPERQEELLRAKAGYFEKAGEVHEDDRSFEARMAAFLEHFLFDRPLDGVGLPPAAAFVAANRDALSPEELAIFDGFTRTLHAVFEVRKLGTKIGLKVREPFSGTDYDVFERRVMVGMEKGDLIDARLVPYEGKLLFSGAFLYHPREARKAVLKEVKRRKKADPAASPQVFAWELSRLALKMERYRNVAVENIYRFEG